MSKTLPKVNIKQTDIKNIYPNYIVSNTDKYDIKHASIPTQYGPNIDKSNINHTITPTTHGVADPIVSQSNIIQLHQQRVKILAEMEQEVHLKQKQKTFTNIHGICSSNKSKTNKIEVSNNEYYIL